MGTQGREDLKGLFERFTKAEQADKAAEDIRKGEEIFRKYPAAEPDEAVLAEITGEIAEVLRCRKKWASKRVAWKVAAVAAVFIILTVLSVKLYEGGSDKYEGLVTASLVPRAIWESDNIAADDQDLALLAGEIEQLENEILAAELGENKRNGHEGFLELELEAELMEIENTFWKG